MKKLTVLLVAVSLFMASPVKADFTKSLYYLNACNELKKLMDGEESLDTAQAHACIGFVTGATRMRTITAYLNKNDGNFTDTYCAEDGGSTQQVVLIWHKFLEDNPQDLHVEPILTFIKAMQEAFPCPQ